MESTNQLQPTQVGTKNHCRQAFLMGRCLLFALLSFALLGCEEESRTSYLPGNSGNQGEILVLAPAAFWKSVDADFLRSALNKEMEGLPAAEPFFTILEVNTEGFSDIFKTHRNILQLRVDATNKTSVNVRHDIFAKQQLQVVITLNQESDLGAVVETQMDQILWLFHESELNRLISRNKAFGSKEINQEIVDLTGLNLTMQQDFVVAKKAQDLVWLRLDREKPIGGYQHQINQGILIYSRPYIDTAQFSDSSLFKWKNDINQLNVEGPSGSHMTISTKLYTPVFKSINFHDQAAKEMRGLWRMDGVKGVFMGGPFYALAFYAPTSQKQFMIEGYVYGPQFNKRAFIREVEAIIKSVQPSES